MSLHVKYRPTNFKTIIGNDDLKVSLGSVLKRENPPPAFLFIGPSGCGKTTFGRMLKYAFKVSDADYKELNAADDRGIDAVRALIQSMKYAPLSGNNKLYLLDEVHQITSVAQESLLKSLEEPPPYVHWALCTTNPEALKDTLIRRCLVYEVQPLKESELHKLFSMILKKEGREDFPVEVLNKIIELANGSSGVALKLLDQVIDMDDIQRALGVLKTSGVGETEVINMCRILTNKDMVSRSKWSQIKKMLKDYSGNAEAARRPILGYLNSILLNNGDDSIYFMMEKFTKNFYDSGKAGLTMAFYSAIFDSEEES